MNFPSLKNFEPGKTFTLEAANSKIVWWNIEEATQILAINPHHFNKSDAWNSRCPMLMFERAGLSNVAMQICHNSVWGYFWVWCVTYSNNPEKLNRGSGSSDHLSEITHSPLIHNIFGTESSDRAQWANRCDVCDIASVFSANF